MRASHTSTTVPTWHQGPTHLPRTVSFRTPIRSRDSPKRALEVPLNRCASPRSPWKSGSRRTKLKRLRMAASIGATDRSVVLVVAITYRLDGTKNSRREYGSVTSTGASQSEAQATLCVVFPRSARASMLQVRAGDRPERSRCCSGSAHREGPGGRRLGCERQVRRHVGRSHRPAGTCPLLTRAHRNIPAERSRHHAELGEDPR